MKPVYFLVNIRIKDAHAYQKYLERVDEVFEGSGGKYLAVDEKPEVLEGTWNFTRSVLIRFDTEGDFRKWYESEEYREILSYRLKAAECDGILIHGFDSES